MCKPTRSQWCRPNITGLNLAHTVSLIKLMAVVLNANYCQWQISYNIRIIPVLIKLRYLPVFHKTNIEICCPGVLIVSCIVISSCHYHEETAPASFVAACSCNLEIAVLFTKVWSFFQHCRQVTWYVAFEVTASDIAKVVRIELLQLKNE